jgi:hypothetical protein
LCACAPPANTTPTANVAQERPAELWNADNRTILSGDAAHALVRQCSRVSPGPVEGVWTPTDADVQRMEGTLILEVSKQFRERGVTLSPGDYYRQYAGFVIGGRRIIYVNGVVESAILREPNPDHPFDWRTQAVSICDGGTITFGAEYDPELNTVSNFAFNGQL